MSEFIPTPMFAGMEPWLCRIVIDGKTYGITLYATDPKQIEEDFPNVKVDGRSIGWVES